MEKNRKPKAIKNQASILLAGAFLLLGGCSGFLDEIPDNRVTLDNLTKAAQTLTSAYSEASPAFTDWMTDDMAIHTLGTTVRQNHAQAFVWEDITTGPTVQDSPEFFWYETYNAIAHSNEVLSVLDNLPAETDELKRRKKAIEAEALLTRAYGHFMLVNMFSKHFNPNTAGSDLGIPYIKTPETTFLPTYSRGTVLEVYNNIEADLLRGLELVDDSFYANSGKYHFNKNAALAFASRFYLYKADFIRCIDYSSRLLGSNPENFVRDLTSSQFLAEASGTGYSALYSSPELPGNLMLMRKVSLVQRNDFAFGVPSSFFNSFFNTHPFAGFDDRRDEPAFVKGSNAVFPVRYESLFQRSSLNSNVGTPYHIAIAFRGEEVLLNRAEAHVHNNKFDKALEDLNILVNRRYRGPGNITLDLNQVKSFYPSNFTDFAAMLNFVVLEKRKEFIVQGMRWFDLKRYRIPIVHRLQNGSTVQLQGDDLRKVFQIPTSAIELSKLKPNPR